MVWEEQEVRGTTSEDKRRTRIKEVSARCTSSVKFRVYRLSAASHIAIAHPCPSRTAEYIQALQPTPPPRPLLSLPLISFEENAEIVVKTNELSHFELRQQTGMASDPVQGGRCEYRAREVEGQGPRSDEGETFKLLKSSLTSIRQTRGVISSKQASPLRGRPCHSPTRKIQVQGFRSLRRAMWSYAFES